MTDRTSTEANRFDYHEELPADKERVWSLLQSYSHIPRDEIESHLRDIYFNILECLKSGGVLLDAGCAFGYILRQIAIDDAPAANLIGIDLQRGFLDLGYDLFKDRDTFEGKSLASDLLNPDDHSLDVINDTVDVSHAAALFHLFDWEDQVSLGTRQVKFFKKDAKQAMIVGRQIGTL
ncbi:hypothetical protein N7478_002474 [Penicillium angulare]|uniref:uncharacterized protein n=1 Tax=Penicillium angulare TaxID=116970 RepID=UPI002541976C|nr:uncharacterized protein N7478_002474 [Penicillium angulare]KAJ5286788.1 hypothetical protein N7478_002474 [Penicillium angulare]